MLPATITNRFGHTESTLAYLIRHSQLLPREFILLFNKAIVDCYKHTGSWRHIDQDAIVRAVSSQEPELVGQILDPYRPLYPHLVEMAKDVISQLPPIFTRSDADRFGKRFGAFKFETMNPWEMLFEIGVIGYIDNRKEPRLTDTYEYGRFHFNSKSEFTLANDRRYCVHPLFSGSWGLRLDGRGQNCRFIYPADVSEDIWVG